MCSHGPWFVVYFKDIYRPFATKKSFQSKKFAQYRQNCVLCVGFCYTAKNLNKSTSFFFNSASDKLQILISTGKLIKLTRLWQQVGKLQQSGIIKLTTCITEVCKGFGCV